MPVASKSGSMGRMQGDKIMPIPSIKDSNKALKSIINLIIFLQ
jgi:hypothetical protein